MKKPTFIQALPALLISGMLVVSSIDAAAYPITPRPLRKMISESEYIIIAFVRKVTGPEIRQGKKGMEVDFDSPTIAELRIIDVLKGRIRDSVILVPYEANWICPAPPHFEEQSHALVFLDKTKGEFDVHALSYGVKTMSLEELQVYKARIKEMQDILLFNDKDDKFFATTEWLVRCAENPATRHEGTYELSRKSDFMSFYDDSEKEPFQFNLSRSQKIRLKDALLSSSKPSFADMGLIDLVYEMDPEAVYNHMLVALENMEGVNCWFAGGFMERILVRKSTPTLQDMAKRFEQNLYGSRFNPEEMQAIVKEFVAEARRS